MTLDFYWEPLQLAAVEPRLTRGEVKAVFDAQAATSLGAAGGGDTWLVERRGRRMVVKIPTSNYTLSRVAREIEGLRRGASPRLVKVIEVEQVTFSIGARVVITFEYVEGTMLDAAIRNGVRPSGEELRSFLSGTLSGLEVLHQHEAVHRDVKPPNIALRDGLWTEPVLLDLGLARLLDEQPITRYPVALGTPAFMAPEVIQGSRAGKPADVWSLGVVAHILATGRHPFYGGYADRLDETEALERLVKGPEAMTSVPPDIETLILRMLSFEANQRSSAQDARLKIRGRAAAAAEPDFVLDDKKARRAQLLL